MIFCYLLAPGIWEVGCCAWPGVYFGTGFIMENLGLREWSWASKKCRWTAWAAHPCHWGQLKCLKRWKKRWKVEDLHGISKPNTQGAFFLHPFLKSYPFHFASAVEFIESREARLSCICMKLLSWSVGCYWSKSWSFICKATSKMEKLKPNFSILVAKSLWGAPIKKKQSNISCHMMA